VVVLCARVVIINIIVIFQSLQMCASVCLFVCNLKGKRLELSTPNLVHIYSIVVAWRALIQRSKGQGQGHTVTKTVTVARLVVTPAAMAMCCCCRRRSACRYNCLCFLVYITLRYFTLHFYHGVFVTFSHQGPVHLMASRHCADLISVLPFIVSYCIAQCSVILNCRDV